MESLYQQATKTADSTQENEDPSAVPYVITAAVIVCGAVWLLWCKKRKNR